MNDISTIASVKGPERYVVICDEAHKAEALRTFGRWASNPDLSFSWYDAALASQKVRESFSRPVQRIQPDDFCGK